MATTKATGKGNKAKTDDHREKLISAYKEFVLLNGHEPPSVFQFMRVLDMAEENFYKHFGAFSSIQREIWKEYITNTMKVLQEDKLYAEYSIREKLLAFYYTLMEVLKKDRSYAQLCFRDAKRPELTPSFLKSFKADFNDYIRQLISEGLASEEIVKRPVITERYHDALWLQVLFVINFWLKDDSANFEKTDAAIEKSVNLSFELMGRGPLDMMVDFAKFLYQNR